MILKKISRKKKLTGGIDQFSLKNISGWIYIKDKKISKVCLKISNQIIAITSLDLFRSDIKELYGGDGKCGFNLSIPNPIQNNTNYINPRIFAITENKEEIDLYFLWDKDSTSRVLTRLFRSKYLGVEGFIDEYDNNKIKGIFYHSPISNLPDKLWMQCQNSFPMEYSLKKIPDKKKHITKFEIDIISKRFNKNKLYYFSFDREGLLLVKTNSEKLPINKYQSIRFDKTNSGVSTNKKDSFEDSETTILQPSLLESSSKKNEDHWHALENFKIYLDTIESEIKYKENLKSKKSKFLQWFKENKTLKLFNRL